MRNYLLQRFLLLGCVLCPAITAVRADTISNFNFNAIFANGATGTGLLRIDVTAGMLESLDIQVIGRIGTYDFTGNRIYGVFGDNYVVEGFDVSDDAIAVRFPQDSLVGYTGGQLCSTSLPCTSNQTSSLYATGVDNNVSASIATLTPAIIPAAPEIDPSLAYGAIVMLAGTTAVMRGRRRS